MVDIMIALYIILGLILVLGLIFVSLFNRLSRQKVNIDEATSDIETLLKQRYDMIPNLVETVKGYAKHEQGTFESITTLRSQAMNAGSFEEKAELEDQLSKGLSKIFALAENYPELKANTNFLELQSTLKELEDNIQKSRRYYNGTVRDFNNMIVVFPNNIIANMLGFKAMPFFEASDEEKKNVEVKF